MSSRSRRLLWPATVIAALLASGVEQTFTAPAGAGHGYTLTLVSRDDNHPDAVNAALSALSALSAAFAARRSTVDYSAPQGALSRPEGDRKSASAPWRSSTERPWH